MAAETHRVYVDLDDVLGETARAFLDLLSTEHGRDLSLEDIASFDLGESFGFEKKELEEFMHSAHRPEVLASILPMDGAIEGLESWTRAGHKISVVTGRPPQTRSTSLEWLTRHGFPFENFYLVDKYSSFYEDARWHRDEALHLDDLAALDFTFAVEDFPGTAEFLAGELEIPVALLDRPWNRDLDHVPPAARRRIVRCRGWHEILERFPPAL